MNVIIIIAGLCALAAACLLVPILNRTRQQENLAKKVRQTNLYGHVYPFLKKHDREELEEIIFRPEGITVRMFAPLGEKYTYTFSRHALDDPSQDVLFALAQAATLDMKCLRRYYTFSTHRSVTPAGVTYSWYSYTIRSARKDELLRSLARKEAAREKEK